MKHNWEYKTIRSMCDNTPYKGVISSHDGKYWLLNLDKIASGEGKVIEYEYFRDSDILDGSVTTFGKNYVLYSKLRPNLNKVVVAKDSGFCTTELIPLCPNKALNSYFLAYFLRSPIFLSYITGKVGGAKMPRAKMNEFWSYCIPVPPMEVQERIVAELDEINGMIEAKREQLKQLDLLAQSIFYSSFGDPISNPKGWETHKFSDTFKLKSGSGLSAKDIESGSYPVYGGNGVVGYHKQFNITGDNIIIGRVGALCGNVRNVKGNAYITDNAFILTHQKGLDNIFILYLLNLLNLRQYAKAVAQPVISNVALKDLTVIFPPLALQQQFAARVEAIEARKAEIEATIKELQTLLDSRMDFWFN